MKKIGVFLLNELDVVDWCERRIKEASEDADLESFEAYTQLLKSWTLKKEQSLNRD